MKTIRTKVYQFSELSKKAQERVINERINDMLQYEIADHYKNWPEFKKAVDKAEEMKTPWFMASYVYEYCKNAIISELHENTDWHYTKDGKFF